MDTNLIAILGVGIALASLMITSQRATRDELRHLGERIDRLSKKVDLLAERQAKLEGLLEGLREAMTGRRVSS